MGVKSMKQKDRKMNELFKLKNVEVLKLSPSADAEGTYDISQVTKLKSEDCRRIEKYYDNGTRLVRTPTGNEKCIYVKIRANGKNHVGWIKTSVISLPSS